MFCLGTVKAAFQLGLDTHGYPDGCRDATTMAVITRYDLMGCHGHAVLFNFRCIELDFFDANIEYGDLSGDSV